MRLSRNSIWIAAAVIVCAGWYFFRPEKAFTSREVDEPLPGAGAAGVTPMLRDTLALQPVLRGHFHDVAHGTAGTATVYRRPNGSHLLRLENFHTSDGPDVRVYLVATTDANDAETVKRAGFIELGVLKGTDGSQNYEIPRVDHFERYRAVTIWCKRFSVNFGTAPLTDMLGVRASESSHRTPSPAAGFRDSLGRGVLARPSGLVMGSVA